LAAEDGTTFSPTVLLVGGDSEPVLAPSDSGVTARVLGAVKGPKVRIGKYKKRTGYRRHTGFRASLTQIEIESIGGKSTAKQAAKSKAPAPANDGGPADSLAGTGCHGNRRFVVNHVVLGKHKRPDAGATEITRKFKDGTAEFSFPPSSERKPCSLHINP